jgi:hypothetical protein
MLFHDVRNVHKVQPFSNVPGLWGRNEVAAARPTGPPDDPGYVWENGPKTLDAQFAATGSATAARSALLIFRHSHGATG